MIRAPVDTLVAGAQRLSANVARYVVGVRRVRVGDVLVLFCPNTGEEADTEIVHISSEGVDVVVGGLRAAKVGALSATLIYALSKGDKIDKVVQDATELGAEAMIVVETERSIVKLEAGKARVRLERWERIAIDAARQCGRATPMRIHGPIPLAASTTLLESAKALRIVLAPSAAHSLGSRVTFDRPLVFAIGPEGGFSTTELAWFSENGFEEANLGSRVLRTETVAAAVLGGMQLLLDRDREGAS